MLLLSPLQEARARHAILTVRECCHVATSTCSYVCDPSFIAHVTKNPSVSPAASLSASPSTSPSAMPSVSPSASPSASSSAPSASPAASLSASPPASPSASPWGSRSASSSGGAIGRCRDLYTNYLKAMPHNCKAWAKYADLERSVGETEVIVVTQRLLVIV